MRKAILTATAASTLALTAACGNEVNDPDPTDHTDHTEEAAGPFADGTYDATASYQNPAGQSDVKVELTLKGEEVTAITVTPMATHATSKQFQEKFAGGIADEVVGQKISDIDVDKVAGSSLTQHGFEAALDEIKADARA